MNFLCRIAICCFLFSCNSSINKPEIKANKKYKRFVDDTINNQNAKIEFQRYLIKKDLFKQLKLTDLENGRDSIEIRLWWEASIYSPSHVYIIKGNGFLWNAKQINYYLNYSTLKIDSFFIENLKPKDLDWQKFISSLSIDKIWTIQPLSEINNKYGCVDGETVRIEVADKTKFKILSYKCYMLYFNEPRYSYCKLLVERINDLLR